VTVALKTEKGLLYIAFYGTCVSMFRAGTIAQARRQMRTKVGKGAEFNLRRATETDVARWVDAGGKGVR
jgi:hypothetical protein